MSASSAPTPRVTYGNIMSEGRRGLLGLPMGVTIGAVPVIATAMLMLTRQAWLPALALVLVGSVAVSLMVIGKRQGRTVYERWALRRAHNASVRAGASTYVAGPAGKVPEGSFRLPGLLAASTLIEHDDGYGNRFGVIRLPKAAHYTVVFEAFPDGDGLVDQERVDSMVEHWAAWLAHLGIEEAVVGASVTLETSIDPGVRLARMVNTNLDPSGSPFAKAVAEQLVSDLKTGSPMVSCRIAITFSGKGHDGAGDLGADSMVEDLANRLPGLLSTLKGTGAGGSVRACTAQDIVDFTRVAYDPTVATAVEEARGTPEGTGLTWAEAGPSIADAELDAYFHDRAVSRTWQMWQPPSGIFYSNVLTPLLEPIGGVIRKRVTMLYRPVPASKAADVIESELDNADFAGTEKRRRSARQQQRSRYAEKAAQEEAAGAGLLRFGLLVTVSCASRADLPRADKVVGGKANRARLRVREALGNQAVAFQAALPLGVVLPEHSMMPTALREFL
ncbi:SCO6880 family protein [Cellulomonas hominis]|uniref:SCO6880 family protein n=1 Tax=Cellulomonas hominis TaxID=156981 RepID=UPI001B970F4B|nr:SCO6880 family protein [Cellulomonas hominis]VTR76037.1 hypothetical protein CHMI_00793 [Cellulomonas hominis]